MFTLQNLNIDRIATATDGISAFAHPPGWHYEYDFFIRANGTVTGKTSSGEWVELDTETSISIRDKVRNILFKQRPA